MKLFPLITEYVAFKQSLGMRFRSEAGILKSFCRTLGDIHITEVDSDSVQTFLAGKRSITTFWHQKFKVLAAFYRFAMSRGYTDSSPLPQTIPKRPESRAPYIYSLEELRRLLAGTDLLESPSSPLQATTFRTLLLTLYSTGLRISEAISLTLADVNLPKNLIVVRNTKFFKTRLVPIGPRLTDKLHAYAKRRRQLSRPAGEHSAFFATRTGNALSYDRVKTIFPFLRHLAGIHPKESHRCPPRIHDLRHTFAVHRLESWYREGADVQRLLSQLSTYLGHVDVRETQCYLSMTTELLQEANRRFERYRLSEVNHG